MTAITSETSGPQVRSDRLLRLALRIDAVCSGVSGIALAAAANWLAVPSGLPLTVEYVLAAFLVAYAVGVWYLSRLPSVRRPGIAVVVGNLVFTVAAVLVVLEDVWPLTAIGVTLMIVSAVYTLAMADMQYLGVRRV
jgi:hypothetical protein